MLKRLAAILLALSFAAPVGAASSFMLPTGDKMVFSDNQCSDPEVIRHVLTLAGIQPAIRGLAWGQGAMTWKGEEHSFCFAHLPKTDMLFVVDDTGDSGVVPLSKIQTLTSV